MLKCHAWQEAGVTTLGAFGILAIEVGIPAWGALLMSLLIYAGAGPFLAVTLLAAGAGLVEVAVATLMLNSRHLFYGLSLLRRFQGAGWRKPYLVFALTDETYSLLTTHAAAGPAPAAGRHRGGQLNAAADGWPMILASLAVVSLHLWQRNALLSIIGGTGAYMAMVQLGWAP